MKPRCPLGLCPDSGRSGSSASTGTHMGCSSRARMRFTLAAIRHAHNAREHAAARRSRGLGHAPTIRRAVTPRVPDSELPGQGVKPKMEVLTFLIEFRSVDIDKFLL